MMKNFKTWVKTNKTKLVAGTVIVGGTVGAGLLYYKFGIKPTKVAKDKYKAISDTATENVKKFVEPEAIPVKLGIGTVTDLWKEAGNTHMIVNDICVDDLGKLGECMQNVITDTTGKTQVSAVIGLFNPDDAEIVVDAVEESL